MKVFKFTELFRIDSNNVKLLINDKKYFSRSRLIKNDNFFLNKFGVYFIFDTRINLKKKINKLNNLIYIGKAGGTINSKSKPGKGQNFFERLHKHWLVSIGADKKFKPKPYLGISGNKHWRSYRSQKSEKIIYKKKMILSENHFNWKIGLNIMNNNSFEDKKNISNFEAFSINYYKEITGHIPICNDKFEKINLMN